MTISTLGDLSKMTSSLGPELARAQRLATKQAAERVLKSVRQEIKLATGGNDKLSGVGFGGSKPIVVRMDMSGGAEPSAVIYHQPKSGPLWLIEFDTPSHDIWPRRARRRSGRAALKLNNSRFASHAMHPGTRAKRPFHKGVEKSKKDTGRIFDEEVGRAIKRVMH